MSFTSVLNVLSVLFVLTVLSVLTVLCVSTVLCVLTVLSVLAVLSVLIINHGVHLHLVVDDRQNICKYKTLVASSINHSQQAW